MALDVARRAVLIDMAYEIGGRGLAAFTHMLTAFRAGDWNEAAAQLKHSKLYGQVQHREDRNIEIIKTGSFPTGITTARELVKLNEGCILTAQPDAKGMWAIGYGHDIPPPTDGRDVTCTLEHAEILFRSDFPLAEQRAELAIGKSYW